MNISTRFPSKASTPASALTERDPGNLFARDIRSPKLSEGTRGRSSRYLFLRLCMGSVYYKESSFNCRVSL
ncbi:hypothetical protein GIB67_009122 [Kingdonia uniflora]|uniref:Uncharacterized protein n=1 Tax=Kingdonia uniflora TaxID=39325 RepID=A0A7J7N254_9MAGN|nr:hypothetical protein GIB67_009122 [Kingdonia uniflora]